MDNYTPEQLKALAEWVAGDRVWLKPEIKTSKPNYWRHKPDIPCDPYVYVNGGEYDPLTNTDQNYELFDGLLEIGEVLIDKTSKGYDVFVDYIIHGKGETLKAAIVDAAAQHVEGKG